MLQVLFGAYPNTQPNEMTYAAYLEVFKDVPKEELWPLITQDMTSPGAFPPSAGDLKELWRKAKGLLPPDDGAMRCIESIKAAIKGTGSWGTPKFKDAVTQRVVKAYGWKEICENGNPDALFAHLKQMYTAFAAHKADEARMTKEYKRLVEDTSKRLTAVDTEVRNEGRLLPKVAPLVEGNKEVAHH